MSVKQLTSQNKDTIIGKGKGVVMVDFFATWCSPCKMLAPTIEEIANETTITVAKCDIDESEAIAREYHIMSVPTVVIFKDGSEIQRFVGVREKDELINALRNA